MKAERVMTRQDAAPTDVPTASLDTAIANACARIAPLWPLKHFVAVNPFLGFSGRTFEATAADFKRIANARTLMPRSFYRTKLDEGFVTDDDIRVAGSTPAALRADAAKAPEPRGERRDVVATVADVLDSLADGDREASRTGFMIDEISKWCAAYFDEGQASWKMPWRALKPYAAWRQAARFDRNPEVMGIAGFRKTIAALPQEARATIAFVVGELGIPHGAREDYLHRALIDIQGWASYARYLAWDNALYGRPDDTLFELLAIRVAWGYALFKHRSDDRFKSAWAEAMADAARLTDETPAAPDAELAIDLRLQAAYEAAHQRRLIGLLANPAAATVQGTRKSVQAAFCIDVRSEVFRRALETVSPEVETLGFAGFFGFPIEYVPIGHARGGAQCPVLLKPAVVVGEHVAGATEDEEVEVLGLRLLRRRAAKTWKAFKLSAVSSFTFVESMGLTFAVKMISDGLGLTRPVPHPSRDGLDADISARVGPRIEAKRVAGRATGFEASARVDMAETVLRAMSLTANFARIVMLTGHGSTTVNNPHASSLDCGACGGHTGEANARVAAAILNDAGVRLGLKARGIDVPADTLFLGCMHDTTTDEIRIFQDVAVPPSHGAEIRELKDWLARAAILARAERARRLDVPVEAANKAVPARSRDWSQVRPEWGLAGNTAFIAAPRARTAGLNLEGRAFLHNYDWASDKGFGVLELIMTAPMVVASWINLQYYGSTVNNRLFGSGNKVLHNVVGALGVLEGNAGDLKVGLPLQSVHDGRRFAHDPVRLSVFIEAPETEMNRIIAKHQGVRELVDNGWLHLFSLGGEDGRTIRKYFPNQQWRDIESA